MRGLNLKLSLIVSLGICGLFTALTARCQPIVDSLKALEMRNAKMYRQMSDFDPKGASYEFTNVTAWHITDDDLKNQIISVLKTQPFSAKTLETFNPEDVYVFAAPAGQDRWEPFHILMMGRPIKALDTTGGGSDVDLLFGSAKKHTNTNERIPIAFKGRDIIRLMRRQPALLDNINAIQGESVELPGEITPSGVQLIKSAEERYIFHQMFEGFYSKRQIVDEQNRAAGLPTIDESYAVDTNAVVIPVDPEASTQSTALPDEAFSSRAFRYDKAVDISIDHLTVNLSRSNSLELQLGNPEVGLPFWTSGEGRLWFIMKNQVGSESNFKLGLAFPANLGRDDLGIFNARRLSGFFGGSVDAYFAGVDFFSAFNMPIALNFTVLPRGGYNSSIIYNGQDGYVAAADGTLIKLSNRTFYRTSFIGQLYIPIIVQLDPANFVQLSAGVGIQTVYHSWIPTADDLNTTGGRNIWQGHGSPLASDQADKVQDLERVSTPFTPHVALQFVNHRSNKFGLNFQYDHLFTFGAWIEVWEDHLRIEGSYTAPLVRDAKPYEPPYFFEITPRFYF